MDIYLSAEKFADVHRRFVSLRSSRRPFLMISTDIRELARCSLIFRVSRGNRQQHCFSLALSRSPLTLHFSRSFAIYLTTGFWDSFFNTRTHREDLLPRTRRGPLVMTATLQCTRRVRSCITGCCSGRVGCILQRVRISFIVSR